MQGLVHVAGQINLQATLSASSASSVHPVIQPHHPITCPGQLALYEDGSLACDHARTDPGDPRVHDCLNHSVALLIVELASQQL